MLERVIMIYLAFATVATAAVFPLPVRAGSSVPREERPPTEPPTSARPDSGLAAVAEPIGDGCAACDVALDDLRAEVAGAAESALDRLESAPLAEDENEDLSTGELEERDLLAKPAPAPASRGERLADVAAELAGLPYSWGGISPATGFDCSGLVYYVHRQLGVTLGRDATAQFHHGQPVQRGDLQPGDIVFFTDTYTSGISHDGIYLGDGRFVHAVQPGSGVKITSMSDGYWGPRYVGARRVFDG